jgi:hypothetical protein
MATACRGGLDVGIWKHYIPMERRTTSRAIPNLSHRHSDPSQAFVCKMLRRRTIHINHSLWKHGPDTLTIRLIIEAPHHSTSKYFHVTIETKQKPLNVLHSRCIQWQESQNENNAFAGNRTRGPSTLRYISKWRAITGWQRWILPLNHKRFL